MNCVSLNSLGWVDCQDSLTVGPGGGLTSFTYVVTTSWHLLSLSACTIDAFFTAPTRDYYSSIRSPQPLVGHRFQSKTEDTTRDYSGTLSTWWLSDKSVENLRT